MKTQNTITTALAFCFVLALTSIAQAAFTPISLWKFGEDDTSAKSPGDPHSVGVTTDDSIGSNDFANTNGPEPSPFWAGFGGLGTPTFESVTGTGPAPGSTLMLRAKPTAGANIYNNGNASSTGFVPSPFTHPSVGNDLTYTGVDLWVMFDTPRHRGEANAIGSIFSFGLNAGDLFEIGIRNTYNGQGADDPSNGTKTLRLGVDGASADSSDGPLTVGQWYHVAAFSTATDTFMYVDGNLVATINDVGTRDGNGPNWDNLDTIGGWDGGNSDWALDNLRVFTFDSNDSLQDIVDAIFSTAEPATGTPEPSSILLAALAFIGSAMIRRRRRN